LLPQLQLLFLRLLLLLLLHAPKHVSIECLLRLQGIHGMQCRDAWRSTQASHHVLLLQLLWGHCMQLLHTCSMEATHAPQVKQLQQLLLLLLLLRVSRHQVGKTNNIAGLACSNSGV
jgi:hypothetical protein